jgi:hypothetical protein
MFSEEFLLGTLSTELLLEMLLLPSFTAAKLLFFP